MMRSLTRYSAILALVLCCTASSSFAQTPALKKSPGGIITGKVTLKGKAAPGIVVGVRVGQPTTPFEPTFRGTTDEEGKYRISDVPAGSYEVVPAAPAFVIFDSANPRGQTVVLTEGESVDGIDFALVRGGVITGKVTDAEGRPVVEQRVNLNLADQQPNQRPTVYSFTVVQTDDRGIYRMFGLAAGRYKISVGQSGDSFFMAASGRQTYKQTFHPDTTDASKASVVEVTEGSETSNVDIALGRVSQTFAASGRVINGENGPPLGNVRFGLQLMIDAQRRVFVSTNTLANSKGEFKIEGLMPGKYAISILPDQESDLRAEAVAFEIVDQDVSDLLIKSSLGISVAGMIVLENTDDKAVTAKLLQLSVHGYVQSERPSGSMVHTAAINSDGSFLIKGLEAGTAFISLGATRDRALLKGFTIARTERDGVIQPRGLEIKNGDQVTGVRVVVSYGNGTVHGVINVENGTLPANAHLFVRVTKTGETSPSLRSPQVDARGHFMMEGIPGGAYEFSVTVIGAFGLGPHSPTARQEVSVPDGVVTDVVINLDLSQKPGPSSP